MSDSSRSALQILADDPAFERELERKMPEMVTLHRLVRSLEGRARIRVEDHVEHKGRQFPLITVTLGSEDPKAPTLGVFGGVHGLERIGSDVVISWLQTLTETLTWDHTVRERLQHSRVVFFPIVNPVGIYEMTRANGRGVDLMRNSPTRADDQPWFLIGGHSISNRLPYFSPPVQAPQDMEVESRALARVVEREFFQAEVALTVDVHSGFGSKDRFWFPWAKSLKPPPHIEEITALKRLFDRSYPNHFYEIEPQAKNYTTHGDLWDWLYDRHLQQQMSSSSASSPAAQAQAATQSLAPSKSVFIPFTLELGSWIWLKKNPRQLFNSLGGFHPMQPHRLKRILRRHITLLDFLHRAVLSHGNWLDLDPDTRRQLRRRALDLWYEGKS